jgi:hypothetical protein
MLLKGDVTIRALRKRVWDFVNDPNPSMWAGGENFQQTFIP